MVASKRTHKHSYNAKSGVGIIIGKETCLWGLGTSAVHYAVNNPRNYHLNWHGSSSAI